MRKYYFIILLLLVFCNTAKSEESFYIKDYQVNINLKSNGSAEIEEIIVVNFTSERRGIIRSIPISYENKKSEAYENAIRDYSSSYSIFVKNVNVENYEFTVLPESKTVDIRIGSADKYISGEHTYKIKYTVWGAINQFLNHNEFTWNPIGHEWDCRIEKASFKITLQKPINLKDEEIIVYTGYIGSKNQNFKLEKSSKEINVQITDTLNPYNGATIALVLPKNYFNSLEIPFEVYVYHYYIKNYNSKIKIHNDASISIEEDIVLEVLDSNKNFSFGISRSAANNLSKTIISDVVISNNDKRFEFLYDSVYNNIKIKDNFKLPLGSHHLILSYNLNGSINIWDKNKNPFMEHSILPILLSVPVKNINVKVKTDKNITFIETPTLHESIISETNDKPKLTEDNNYYSIEINEPKRFVNYKIYSTFNKKDFNFQKASLSIFNLEYIVKNFNIIVEILENGLVKVKGEAEIYNNSENCYYQSPYYLEIPNAANHYSAYSYEKYGFLNNKVKLIIKDAKINDLNEYSCYYTSCYAKWNCNKAFTTRKVNYEYSIYDVLKKEGEFYILKFPIIPQFCMKRISGKLEIIMPKEIETYKLDMKLMNATENYSGTYQTGEEVNMKYSKNKATAEFGIDIENSFNNYVVDIKIPKQYINKNNTRLNFKIIFINNIWIIFSVLFILTIAILWFFFGKDKKHPLVVQYNPPKDLTPAEAGYIWDHKLHKRDMISLIIWWASKGYIKIVDLSTNETNEDYELQKIKELPDNAKSFEKTIFKGIFGSNINVKISSLKNTFYITLNKAFKELKSGSNNEKLYIPGSRIFSAWIKVFGFIFLAIGIIMFLVDLDNMRDFQDSVSTLLFSSALIVFSYIMPKRSPFGSENYAHLQGLEEFIKTVEKEKLEWMRKNNIEQLNELTAYAIVMGYSSLWAEKLSNLTSYKCEWFEENTSTDENFQFDRMMRRIINSMHKMESVMTSKPSPSGNYSSSGGYSGGFSRSFSSGGSSRSFSSGGGYSGGGFGGGGGKSW